MPNQEDKKAVRSCLWGTLVYPTKEFYYKYLEENDLISGFDSSDHCPLDKNMNRLYNGVDGWGEFDDKEYRILTDVLVDFLISPLHYLDIDEQEEEFQYKKPHFHLLFIFESMKSLKQVSELFATFKGVGAKKLDSRRKAARYLCHLDHPHKAQYDTKLVYCTGSINYYELINTVSDVNAEVGEMINYILENHIMSFSRFSLICLNQFPIWYNLLLNSKSYFIDKFIKSYAWEIENKEKIKQLENLAINAESEL